MTAPSDPSRDEFLALARDHTVVPVWREVLADLETPVSAFVKLVGPDADGPPGLPARVGRARRALGAVLVPRPRPGADDGRARPPRRARRRRPAGHPDRPGRARRARGAARGATGPRASPSCRRSTAASSATSATTSCARSSTCPTSRPTTSGLPDAVLVAHRPRHRVRPLPPAALPDRERLPQRRRRPVRRLRRAPSPASTAASTSWPARCRTSPSPPPADELTELPAFRSTMAGGLYRDGGRGGPRVHPRRRHLPGRARAALRPRRAGRPVRRVPRAAPGQPVAVHVLPAPPRGDARRARRPSRWCSCSTAGSSAGRSRGPGSAAAPRSTTGASPPSSASTRRSGPST